MSNIFSNRLILAIAILSIALFLSPLLLLGPLGDTALNSYIDGWLRWNNTNVWAFTLMVIELWAHNEGRFMPLNLGSVYVLNDLVHTAFGIHAVQIGFICANALTLYAIARRITGNPLFGTLVVACIAVTLQVRFPIDPIAGFEPLLPLTLEFLFLAVLGQVIYQRNRRPLVLWLAVAAYAASALTYEITCAFIPIFLYFAFRDADVRSRYVQIAAFIAPLIPLTITNIVLRHAAHLDPADTYALSVFTPAYLSTAWIQFIGGVPLVYAAVDPIRLFPSIAQMLVTRPAMALIVGTLLGGISLVLFERMRRSPSLALGKPALDSVLVLGFLLWLLAVPMIAASPRWQKTLVAGQAYLPVYFEYFGVALILASVIARLDLRFASLPTSILLSLVIGAGSAISYQANRPSYRAFQPVWTQGRFALEESVRDGIFRHIPENATILLDDSYVWNYVEQEPTSNSKYLLYFLTNTKYSVATYDDASLKACRPKERSCDLRSKELYSYSSDTSNLVPGERWTRLLRMQFVAEDGDSEPRFYASSGQIIARGAGISEFAEIPAAKIVGARNLVDASRMATVDTCLAVPASDFPNGSAVIFGPSTYGVEKNERESFRWSRRFTSLKVVSGSRGADVTLSFALSSFVPGTKVTIRSDGATSTIRPTAIGTPTSFNFRLAPWSQRSIDVRLLGKPFKAPNDPRELAIRFVNPRATATCTR